MLFRGGGSRFPCSSSAMIDCRRTIDENLNHSTESADQKKIKNGDFCDPMSELIKLLGDDSPFEGCLSRPR